MRHPTFEALEQRTLLSAGTLAPGMGEMFDFNADGVKDAVLVNTGTSAIQYEYLGGTGLASVKLTADGGRFVSSTYVAQVSDNSASDDFVLGDSEIGVSVKYGSRRFGAIGGASRVVGGAVSKLNVGLGDLLELKATEGNIGTVYVRGGNLTNASAVGGISRLVVEGDILGLVEAAGSIDLISADRLSGGAIRGHGGISRLALDVITGGALVDSPQITELLAGRIEGGAQITAAGDINRLQAGRIGDAAVTVGGNMSSLQADTLAGSVGWTNISIAGHLASLVAQTITGGENGTLSLSIGAGLDRLSAGLIEGGTASGAGFAGLFLSVYGTVDKMCMGLLSGGTSTGAGSFSMTSIQVYDLYAPDGSLLEAGDILYLNAAALAGGVSADGGDAMLAVTLSHDLVNARIGQMIGNGNVPRPHCWDHRIPSCCNPHPGSGCDGHQGCDPSVYLSVGHDITKLVVGSITGGAASGDNSYSSMNISAANDIVQLAAGDIDAGSATGAYSSAFVYVNAGRDINSITARTFAGGSARGEGAMAGVFVEAGRNIDFIGAGLITGTEATRPICDPTVRFVAGGNIGMVMAGRITGGRVTADGESAGQASVMLRADGGYVNEDGTIVPGDIGCIVTGMIDGGTARGANSLSYVKISAAHDIGRLYADSILGGAGSDGGFSYVSIVAEHNINELCAGTISGAGSGGGGGGGCGSDPAVQIQAYNDIKSFTAQQIIAGNGGTVNILAGVDGDGNVSGDGDAGSIEHMVVGLISGNGGIVNIAAGGNIDDLKVCRIVSGDGEVNIVAGGDITADVRSIRSWSVNGETGVQFQAGGAVNDVRDSIRDEYVQEGLGGDVEIPAPLDLPE